MNIFVQHFPELFWISGDFRWYRRFWTTCSISFMSPVRVWFFYWPAECALAHLKLGFYCGIFHFYDTCSSFCWHYCWVALNTSFTHVPSHIEGYLLWQPSLSFWILPGCKLPLASLQPLPIAWHFSRERLNLHINTFVTGFMLLSFRPRVLWRILSPWLNGSCKSVGQKWFWC